MLSKQQMLEGFGGAEECQQCGALHCDACYPQRENLCVLCHQRALRLVMVQYATGTTALWPQAPAPVVVNSCAGSPWAISLRKFLATQGQSHLEAAATHLGAELSALPPSRSGLRSFFDNNTGRRALESAWSTMQKVALEDRSPAVPQSEVTASLLRRCGRPEDAESVRLIGPDWQVRMGQSYMMAPAFLQDQILRSGLDACKRCAAMMHSLGDFFCEAEYLTRLGNGLYSARRLEEAEEAFSGALRLWRGLAQNDFGLLVKVGRTLQHLGTTQSARGEYTGCASSYREAVEVLESCADGERDLTAVLNNLGNFHLHRHEYESASSCFQRAVSILEALIRSGVTRSTEDPFSPLLSMQLVVVRGNLALCLAELGSLDRAAELIERTIRDQVNHQDGGNDQARLQLAKLRATLGRIRLQLWTRESNYGQVPHDDLLDAALQELSLATGVFREHLQMSRLAAYLPAVILGLIAHGLALGYRRDFGTAADIIEEAYRLAQSPSLWFERMQALDARRELEVTRHGEPTAGFEYARLAVETAEKGMSALSEAERVNRDLVKSRVEMSYLSCIANLTRRKDYEDLFHVLEAMRRIDRLAESDGHSAADIDLRSAKAFARKHGFTYIASQAAPGGTVFFVIQADGEVTAEPAVPGWANKAFQFSTEIDNAARALEFFGPPDLERLTHQAASLFDDLPPNAKRALGTGSGPIFLSMGADQHNLPMELLYDRSVGWLGLRRICARTRSFEELAAIIERQPSAKSPAATVAAGPGENFERIVSMARSIGDGLVTAGFTLRLADQVMQGDNLTRWKFLDTIDRDPSMVVFVGHGGNDDNGPFLQISADDRLRPRDLAQLRFDSGPIVHLECCIAGHAVYFGGGYWNSYAVSLLANGASCCLVSNRIVFGESSEIFCRELYGQLIRTESPSIGAALLEARRRTASSYPNPLFWATPVLYGNPEARLRSIIESHDRPV
jgi:tetratricopeptide (TPR) repeat protein